MIMSRNMCSDSLYTYIIHGRKYEKEKIFFSSVFGKKKNVKI